MKRAAVGSVLHSDGIFEMFQKECAKPHSIEYKEWNTIHD